VVLLSHAKRVSTAHTSVDNTYPRLSSIGGEEEEEDDDIVMG